MVKGDVVGRVPIEQWKAENVVDVNIHKKYCGELYGVLVSLTSGEAKGILKGMLDSGESDGFKALAILHKRFDAITTGSLLQAYLEVVAPAGIRNSQDVMSGDP